MEYIIKCVLWVTFPTVTQWTVTPGNYSINRWNYLNKMTVLWIHTQFPDNGYSGCYKFSQSNKKLTFLFIVTVA